MPVKESCLHPAGADFRLDVEIPCILKASPSKLNINHKDQRLKPNVENSDCPVFGTIAIQHGFSTRLREFHHLRSLHDVCRGAWRAVEAPKVWNSPATTRQASRRRGWAAPSSGKKKWQNVLHLHRLKKVLN